MTLDDYGIDPDTETFEQERDRRLAVEHKAIAAALARSGVAWTYHEERGDRADRLAKQSVDADLIVVGAAKPGVLHHLLDGESVPKRLVKVQQRPVVIVPQRPDPTDRAGSSGGAAVQRQCGGVSRGAVRVAGPRSGSALPFGTELAMRYE